MSHDQVFDNFGACARQIESDFGIELSANDLTAPKILLRGESFPWPKTESSMHRFLVQEDGKTAKPFHLVSPFVDFEEIYVQYLTERFRTTENEGFGFLQHYGFPTDLFDVSPSADTARFFAVNDHPDACGNVGVFPVRRLQMCFDIIDLTGHSFAKRPKRQAAYAIRPLKGSYDLKDVRKKECFGARWYRFRKTSDDLAFAKVHQALLFPSEEELETLFGRHLRSFLDSHWTQLRTDGQLYRPLIEEKLSAILCSAVSTGPPVRR